MASRWLLIAFVTAALLISGCITPTNETAGDSAKDDPPQPVLMSDTTTWSESVSGPQVYPQEEVLAGPWTFEAPEGLRSLEASLTWGADQNDLRLRITTPSDETLTRSSSGQNVSFAPEDAASGTYTFAVVADGLVVADTVRLTVAHSWLQQVAGDAQQAQGDIQFTQEGGKWRATIVYTAEESGVDDLTLDVDTFNGQVDLARGSGPAKATLKAWARADTKDRAAELVGQLAITLGIDAGTLTAHAVDRTDRTGSESTGASVEIRVPGTVRGTADTSNGGIRLTGIETDGLSLDTSNGAITGDITASGDLTADTSNGAIDLKVVPTDSLTLSLDTSNGAIDLALKEASDIGYRLDADTSNGRISEDMDEASLSGPEDDEKRLETDGFSGRTIQVTGTVGTSNGHVHFKSA